MKARPYADGVWSALPSGMLVWFEGGLPRKLRPAAPLLSSFPAVRAQDALDDLGRITGQRYRLGRIDSDEAQILP